MERKTLEYWRYIVRCVVVVQVNTNKSKNRFSQRFTDERRELLVYDVLCTFTRLGTVLSVDGELRVLRSEVLGKNETFSGVWETITVTAVDGISSVLCWRVRGTSRSKV